MEKKETEYYISKIKKFVDSVEVLDEGKVRFNTMDAVSATYSMAVVILDMSKELDEMKAQNEDYDTRNKKFAGRR